MSWFWKQKGKRLFSFFCTKHNIQYVLHKINLYPMCHNSIFTPEIFSGVGTQNETARIKSAWSDEGSSYQITSKQGLGPISQNLTKVDQVWPKLTKFDWGLTKSFLIRLGSTIPKKPSKCGSGYISQSSESFDQVWLRLTKFDLGLTGPLTRPKTRSDWLLSDQCVEHVKSFDSILYGSKTDKKRGSYGQNCKKTVQHLAKFC